MKPEFPRIELIAVPPEEEGGKWILIAAPLEINESYEVSLPQSVPCDLSFSLEIAPRPDESLTHTFNVPAIFIAAGSPAKPLVIEYTPSSDGAKTMLVSGRVSEFGEVRQQIVANEVFYAGEPPIIMDSGWSLAGPVPGFDIP